LKKDVNMDAYPISDVLAVAEALAIAVATKSQAGRYSPDAMLRTATMLVIDGMNRERTDAFITEVKALHSGPVLSTMEVPSSPTATEP
jgi:hypothetical protein